MTRRPLLGYSIRQLDLFAPDPPPPVGPPSWVARAFGPPVRGRHLVLLDVGGMPLEGHVWCPACGARPGEFCASPRRRPGASEDDDGARFCSTCSNFGGWCCSHACRGGVVERLRGADARSSFVRKHWRRLDDGRWCPNDMAKRWEGRRAHA